MTENIKFQKVMVNTVVIEMCCNDIGCHIICRMLYRGKRMYLFSVWQYNNSAGMLSCWTFNAYASVYNSVDFTTSFTFALFFVIFFYITIYRFICKCSYGSCLICLSFSENYFNIGMCFRLILSWEVQVNIRLFIAVKTEKGLKWNIKSFFFKLCTAFRAYLIRHITASTARKFSYLIGIKINIITFRA